jgi:DNA-binding transcriptional ArsR family regulator
MVEDQDLLDRVFSAIADPTRRAILQRLGENLVRATDIAKKFSISPNAISKHLIHQWNDFL